LPLKQEGALSSLVDVNADTVDAPFFIPNTVGAADAANAAATQRETANPSNFLCFILKPPYTFKKVMWLQYDR
jgi:hypothetical protein